MIQTLHDTGEDYEITSKMDGAVYGTGVADCVCKGVGDEFALQRSSSSLIVGINAGSEAIIGGSFFRVMSNESITLPANSTIYLTASIDTSNQNGAKGYFDLLGSQSEIQKGNLNGNQNTVRDLLLYIITTNGSGVTSVVDKREIRGDGEGASSGIAWEVLSQSEYDSLTTKESNKLYFTYED